MSKFLPVCAIENQKKLDSGTKKANSGLIEHGGIILFRKKLHRASMRCVTKKNNDSSNQDSQQILLNLTMSSVKLYSTSSNILPLFSKLLICGYHYLRWEEAILMLIMFTHCFTFNGRSICYVPNSNKDKLGKQNEWLFTVYYNQ